MERIDTLVHTVWMLVPYEHGDWKGGAPSLLERVFGFCHAVERGQSFEAALGATHDAIVVTNAEVGGADQVAIYANPAFERMSGYSREELVGQSPRMLQGARTDPGELVRMRADLLHQGFFEGEIINYRRGSGEYLMGWAIAAICSPEGDTRFWLSVQNDITRDLIEARRRRMAARAAG